jgi:hypothetical protein
MPQIKNQKTTTILTRINKTQIIILENHQKWLSKGKKTSAELTKRIQEEFSVSKRVAESYISAARKEIRLLIIKQRDKKLNKALLDREWGITKAKEDGDSKLALEYMKDRDKLNELYTEQTVTTNFDIDVNELTDHGLERIKRGDDPREVILDPKSRKIKKDE